MRGEPAESRTPRFRGSHLCCIPRCTARIATMGSASQGACPRSAQTLDSNAGNELRELAKIVLVAADDEVATERRRGVDGRVDPRIGAGRVRRGATHITTMMPGKSARASEVECVAAV